MTNLAQFMLDAAALMRREGLERVQNLLSKPRLLKELQPTDKALALLEDLRRFSPKGLESEAREIEKDFERQRAQPKRRSGMEFVPASPDLIARARAAVANRRSASR